MTEQTMYAGWRKWCPTAEEYDRFEVDGELPFELFENEYLIVCEDEGCTKPINQFCYENGTLRRFSWGSIKVPKLKAVAEPPIDECELKNNGKALKKNAKRKKAVRVGDSSVIYPRNIEQACAIDMLLDNSKTVKLVTGHWGTGKSMLLVCSALKLLRQGDFEKIIWVRNSVDLRDTKDLGALPGEVIDKLLPYLGPFIDHAGKNEVMSMINNETVVVEPLQFLRGRNFENSIIMCSEAENLTKEHIQLIIARAAEGSVVMFDADTKQRDRVAFEKSRGIETMIDRFKGNPLFAYVHLEHGERSATASMADLLN